jgi:osmoprotectant transport system ATP-binding protein
MIAIEGLRKDFGGFTAVADISLEVAPGETLVLLGTSGCGKTTTLRMINRLIAPTRGVIRVDGRDIAGEDPVQLRRKIGYMIQGVGLFPHRTVEENILTVPQLLGWGRERGRARVAELGAIVNLDADLLPRYPHELSGGQRQRVGLARALAADPPIILMDEPLGALDPITRQQVRREFRRIESLVNKTNVLVTHDIAEAVELGDRICLMSQGRIEQIGPAAELLFRPRTEFVRDFFEGGRLQIEWMAVTLGELPLAEADRPGEQPFGLAGSTPVAEALAQLEKADETAFGRVITAFFDYKRARAAASGGGSV